MGSLLAAAAGVAHTASFPPLELWPLQIAALAVLALLTLAAAPRRAAWYGWLFGVGWLGSGLWWIYISLHDYGEMPAPLAVAAVLLLAAALALYHAAAAGLYARWRRGRPVADGLLWAALWLAAELARGQWFTGFPWLAAGYAHVTGPLAGWAPWVGVYGIGAVAALLAVVLAQWVLGIGRRGWPLSVGALLGVALPVALPSSFTEPAGHLRVSLLQPNIAQDIKFDPARMQTNLQALGQQLHEAPGQLAVTPESVVPIPREYLDAATWDALVAPYEAPGRAALIGTFDGTADAGYVNSLIGVSAGTVGTGDGLYHYGKRHLLPFGEYVPPGFRWFVDLMQIPLGDQAAGSGTAPFIVDGQRLRPLICYEDLFGEEFASSTLGPEAATVFVNATNLAWFGRWMVQDQHLAFSRMRALEFQRPFVRATNTGATAFIDAAGQVTDRLPPLVRGTLTAEVHGRTGATPYARWVSAWGLWPGWVLVVLAVGAAWVTPRRPAAAAD